MQTPVPSVTAAGRANTTRCRPSSTVPHSEDARGSFMLDRDVPNDIEFEVGQPVSVGLSQLQIGSRGTFLREVSIVRRGAVKGAEITKRHEIKESAATSGHEAHGF